MPLVTDELIELRGLRLHYRDWPSKRAGAPTLVLLHGYTGHARSWDAFAEGMTDRYRVLALDQRGHGESAWAGAGNYAVVEMTEDLVAFAAAQRLSGFTLLGLSMGGMVAIDYAGRRPEALASLVIVDIGPELASVGAGRIRERQETENDVFANREAAFAAAHATNPLPPEAHHRHRSDHSLMMIEDGRFTYRYDRALRSIRELKVREAADGWRSCATIAVPTLLIRGALSDVLSVDVAQRMIETIPDARLVTVENSGHSVPLDAPDGFLEAARGFLKG